jgi:TAT (twin-arginine translocation) pathway signal sequence
MHASTQLSVDAHADGAIGSTAKEPVGWVSRRSFLASGLAVGAAAGLGPLGRTVAAFADEGGGELTRGDAAILRFLSAAEILETDLWQQYNELGGIQDGELPQGGGSKPYIEALEKLDEDMPQYIHDNTEDELSHFTFINAYLESRGAEPVNLDHFRTLPSSTATGAREKAHEPDGTHGRHQLLDALSQPYQESRPRRLVSAGGARVD